MEPVGIVLAHRFVSWISWLKPVPSPNDFKYGRSALRATVRFRIQGFGTPACSSVDRRFTVWSFICHGQIACGRPVDSAGVVAGLEKSNCAGHRNKHKRPERNFVKLHLVPPCHRSLSIGAIFMSKPIK